MQLLSFTFLLFYTEPDDGLLKVETCIGRWIYTIKTQTTFNGYHNLFYCSNENIKRECQNCS